MDIQTQFESACEKGDLLHAQIIYETNSNALSIYEAFCNACTNGHICIAKWLHNINPTIDVSSNNEYVFRWTCFNGHINVAKWLHNIHPAINMSIWNEKCFRYACGFGHLDIAKWLIEVRPGLSVSSKNNFALRYACARGHIDVVKYLVSIIPSTDLYATYSIKDGYSILGIACYNGHLHIAQYLYHILSVIDVETFNHAFRVSCKHGHLEIAKWLLSIDTTQIINISNDDNIAFKLACANGHLTVAQWLLQIHPEIDAIDSAFVLACKDGQMEVAHWLLDIDSQDYIMTNEILSAFNRACGYGQLDIAKWLYQDYITTYSNATQYEAFEIALYDTCKRGCSSFDTNKHGYLNVVQWLFEECPALANKDTVFGALHFACNEGNLDVAKWLIHIQPNINIFASNDHIYRSICKNNKQNIKLWLQQLYPFKYCDRNEYDKLTIHIHSKCNAVALTTLYVANKYGYNNFTTATFVHNVVTLLQQC
jgi:ankyrin repeat protein